MSGYFHILIYILMAWSFVMIVMGILLRRTRQLLIQQQHDEEIIEQSMNTFMGFIDAKDSNTNGHSARVAEYTQLLAQEIGLSEAECKRAHYIALMHDCGKIGIPDSVLLKPDKLTEEEITIIKIHTTMGGEILRNFTSIEGIQSGALYHHERYDGTGYPHGLAGKDIPLIARIICVADSFDAMNSVRCYQGKMSKADILREFEENKGKQFDPMIVDALFSLFEQKKIELN